MILNRLKKRKTMHSLKKHFISKIIFPFLLLSPLAAWAGAMPININTVFTLFSLDRIKTLVFVEMFIPDFSLLGFGEVISLTLRSLYLFDSLEERGYLSLSFIIITFLIAGLLMFGLCYLVVQTVRMKRNITAMGTVLDQEGEVTEILDDFGKKGWIFIYGENWKYRSEKPLKVGDLVKVIKHKRMDLIVEKISES